jgi:uncharacterized membrane protein HdeD (DUF308 family)
MATQFTKGPLKHWYLPLIIGIIFIGTGIYTFFSPVSSYLALTLLFSISFLVSGIMDTIFAITNRDRIDNWGWAIALGILTLLVGILLIAKPDISIIALPLFVGFMVMFRSFGAISSAIDLKRYGVLEWGNLMVIGVLGVIFSFLLIWNPFFSSITIVVWTGLALLAIGIFGVYVAFKLRKLRKGTV